MKYESDILKRLIDTYGVVGNPQYISEIIKEFIVRGKECFPNLFTYQSDWLAHIDEFGLKPSYTVSYTGQSIYAPNTLEKPVKSAILKGQTLVNKLGLKTSTTNANNGHHVLLVSTQLTLPIVVGEYAVFFFESDFPNPNTDGFIQLYTNKNGNPKWIGAQQFITRQNGKHSIIIKNTFDEQINYIDIYISNATQGTHILDNMMIITRQNGMENWDIPYFTGMQSVKMPVLTTSNEDGTKTNILTVNEDVTLRGVGDVKDELNPLTGEVVERIGEIVLDGSQTLQPHSTVQGDTLMIKISDPSISFKQNSNRQESWDFSDMICDKELIAETTKWNADKWNEGYNIALISSASSSTYNINSFVLAIRKSYFNVQSIDDFKTWLTQNPLTIQYKLAKESIKTVDLTILDQNGQSVDHLKSFNGGTHVYTSSLEGSLVPSVDISVVTNLEETLKVCSLDGNTL